MSTRTHGGGMPTSTGKIPGDRDEYRLLLLCARTRVEPWQHELIRSLVRKPLDWAFVLGKAYWHSLTPLLYRNLKAICAAEVPAETLQQLESHYTANARRNLAYTAQLIQLLRLLESANILAVPYKGPALAALAYGDISLRKFSDLDLIIRQRDVNAAKSLLLSQGYRWYIFKGQVAGPDEDRNFRDWHEYAFEHDGKATVDLHWRITDRRFRFDIDLDAEWERLETATLLGQEINIFPAEVTLLLLCVHGSKDLWWKRIGWICDIAELLGTNPDLDWQGALDLATRSGTRRVLLLGVTLAHELLQAPLPAEVLAPARSDAAVARLAGYVRHRLFDEPALGDRFLEKPRFHISVRERLRDRLPACRHLVSAAYSRLVFRRRKD